MGCERETRCRTRPAPVRTGQTGRRCGRGARLTVARGAVGRVRPSARPRRRTTRRFASMYVPAVPPAPPVLAQAPFTVDSAALGISATAHRSRRTSIMISRRTLDTLAGHAAVVRGRLLVRGAGLLGEDVLLQAWSGGRWSTLAGARTGAAGRFLLRYLPRRIGS